MNTNQAVARALKLENVEWISCFPSNDLIESVAGEKIPLVMFRHERGAIMAADGYSRLNGRKKFGVVITQGGPGAENSMGGIAQAYADNVPILVLQGGNQLDQYAVKPNFSPAKTYESVTRHAEVILSPDQTMATMRRAFHALRNGRPGPVVIEIPKDVADSEVSESALHYSPPKRSASSAAESDIIEAAKVLLSAKKPVIWSGMGTLLANASDELKELAELTKIPVFCSMPGKSSFNEQHPLSLGSGSGTTTLPAHKWLQESDVLFAIGSSLTRTSYGQSFPENKVLIQNSENIDDINKDYSIDVGLNGDAKLTLQSLIEAVKEEIGSSGREDTNGVIKEISALKSKWLADWAPLLNSNEKPINTYRVIGDLQKTLDKDNSIVTHDAGAPRDTIMPFYTASLPHTYIGWGKTTHLGYGIPLMIGAKKAKPERFCLNFMGDGAFGMSGLDLETSVRSGLPITTVLLNNGGMATYPGGYPASKELSGVTYMSGDYATIAEGLGAVGIRVSEPSGVIPAIEEAKRLNADGKACLLDIKTNLEGKRSNFM